MTQFLTMKPVKQLGTTMPVGVAADGLTPVFQEAGGSFNAMSARVTGTTPGKEFVLLKNNDLKNSNVTWLELLIALVDGAYPASPNYHITPTHKIDAVACDHHLGDLIIWATTHALVNNPDGSRNIYLERLKIPGIFV